MSSESPLQHRPGLLGPRGLLSLGLLLAAGAAAFALGLGPRGLIPRDVGWQVAREFFSAALHPALDYEAGWVPPGAPPFLMTVGAAGLRTLAFSLAAMSLAILLGLPLGWVASDAFWHPGGDGGPDRARGGAWRGPLQGGVRAWLALLRSVHELLWAVVLLAALGLTPFTGVIALTIPYSGTLAKVWSELLDESEHDASRALLALGAGPTTAFLIGRLPQALPDMLSYAFYRFECSVRGSAVLGFFGFSTVGLYLQLAFEDLHYREVWTYLYLLLGIVLVLEGWSAAVRKRFHA